MKQFHQSLMRRHRWYAAWHKTPMVSILHFVALAGVTSLLATMIMTASMAAAY